MATFLPRHELPQRLALWSAAPFVGAGVALGIVQLAAWLVLGGQNEWWGTDGRRLLEAGVRLMAGSDIYANPDFLYPPGAALLAVPLNAIPGLGLALAVLRIALAAIVAGWVTRHYRRSVMAFVVITTVTSAPVVQDVILGNVGVFLTASMAAVVLQPEKKAWAALLGVLVAAFAKPLVVPFVLWMAVWRRPLIVPFAAAGTGLAIIAAVIAGPDSYGRWIASLAGGLRFAAPSAWNLGVTAVSVPAFVFAGAITGAILAVVLLRGTWRAGLRAACVAGLLISPYVWVSHLTLLLLPGWVSLAGGTRSLLDPGVDEPQSIAR